MAGGSGASSGKVAYPLYIEAIHNEWLNHGNLDVVTDSMVDVMNAALANNPYTGMVPYNPNTLLGNIDAEISDFETLVNAIAASLNLDDLVDTDVVSDTEINASIAAHRSVLEDQVLSETLPRFQGGMRDIGAVQSSAFTIGQAIIEDGIDREVGKYGADIRLKTKPTQAELDNMRLRYAALKLEFQRELSKLVMEANKVRLVAEKEEDDQDKAFDIADAKWSLEVFQHGANLMAAPSGAGINTKSLPGDPIGMLFGKLLM